MVILDFHCESSYGTDQMADLPPLEWQFHRFWCLLWQLIFVRPSVVGYTPQNGNLELVLIDSYCENSYLADQVTDQPPIRIGISQTLISSLTANIGQTRCGRSTYPPEQWFHRFWFLLWQLIFGIPGLGK